MKVSLFHLLLTAFFVMSASAQSKEAFTFDPAKLKGFEQIFNGKNFDGWEICGGKHDFKVENACVVGTAKLKTTNGFMTTIQKYQDFELQFEVKCDTKLNSGVQIRSNPKPNNGRLVGPQVEIEEGTAGFIYGEMLGTGWLSKDRSGKEKKEAFKANQWNHYRIVAKGDLIQTWVNGVKIANLNEAKVNAAGRIGLQVHSIYSKDVEGTQVRWRNIFLKKLK